MITITAPKKGLGQTVTSINIAVKIGNLLEDRVLLIDSNQYCCGVVEYLSNSFWTRGLDEFKISLESGMKFNKEMDFRCCKEVTSRLNIMASNQYARLDQGDIAKLQKLTKETYLVTLVDSIAGQNALTENFLKLSKLVLVILTQDQSQIRLIRDNGLYMNYRDNVIFVVNQYRESSDGVKIKYSLIKIQKDLEEIGFKKNPIFTLPYDGALINECNDSTLLNYCLSKENRGNKYLHQLEKLVRRVLREYGYFELITDVEVVKEKRSVFSIFNL